MNDLNTTISILKELPVILVGSLTWDTKEHFNLRSQCVEMIKDVVSISSPKRILEIGTHLGHSACLWLSFSEAELTSVDICTNWVEWEYGYENWGSPKANGGGLKESVACLKKYFGDRFKFVKGDSTSLDVFEQIKDSHYDLIFIDGNHDYSYVMKDIETAFKLNIPFILLDDYFDNVDGDERVLAAKNSGLTPMKVYKDIHNVANVRCGFFKNPHYVKD